MGKTSGFSKEDKFLVYFLNKFSWFVEKQGRQGYQIILYLISVDADRIFYRIGKKSVVGRFFNS